MQVIRKIETPAASYDDYWYRRVYVKVTDEELEALLSDDPLDMEYAVFDLAEMGGASYRCPGQPFTSKPRIRQVWGHVFVAYQMGGWDV